MDIACNMVSMAISAIKTDIAKYVTSKIWKQMVMLLLFKVKINVYNLLHDGNANLCRNMT